MKSNFRFSVNCALLAICACALSRSANGQRLSVQAKAAVAEYLVNPGDTDPMSVTRRAVNGGRCAFRLNCPEGFYNSVDNSVGQMVKSWEKFIRSYVIADSCQWYDSLSIYVLDRGSSGVDVNQYDVLLNNCIVDPGGQDRRWKTLLDVLPFDRIGLVEKGSDVSLTLHFIPGYSPAKHLRHYALYLGLCVYDYVRSRRDTRCSVTFVDDTRHKKYTYGSNNDNMYDEMIEGLREEF